MRRIGLHNFVAVVLLAGTITYILWAVELTLTTPWYALAVGAPLALVVYSLVRGQRLVVWVIVMATAVCGFYLMPFMLYAILAGDFLATSSVVSSTELAMHAVETVGAILLFTVFAFSFRSSRQGLVVRTIECPVPVSGKLVRELDGLKIAHVSDFHVMSKGDAELIKRMVTAVNAAEPDLICITGDLVDDRGPDAMEAISTVAQELRALNAPLGVYAVLGNHDINAGDKTVIDGLSEVVTMLNGISCVPSTHMWITGVKSPINWWDDAPKEAQEQVESVVKQVPASGIAAGNLHILLSHFPDIVSHIPVNSFNLVLAGHTHGGQIGFGKRFRHINLGRLVTPFVWGLYQTSNATLHVSAGLGLSYHLPVRIGVPPEISLLVVKACTP